MISNSGGLSGHQRLRAQFPDKTLRCFIAPIYERAHRNIELGKFELIVPCRDATALAAMETLRDQVCPALSRGFARRSCSCTRTCPPHREAFPRWLICAR